MGRSAQRLTTPMLTKLYGPTEPERGARRRCSPSECIGTEIQVAQGAPDKRHISTSYVERHNLTMRMSMRRFTRLTDAFSKKLENHMYAMALYFVHHNFVRHHKSLANPYHRTPAMAAGLTDHIWTSGELLSLLDRSN
jgi:hypothetical protein